jgi:Protein of unknown function (DUF3515)
VAVDPPTPSAQVAEHCAPLSNQLPQRLESLKPRVISPTSPLVHAWGSPAVILRCGVPRPAGYSPSSAETTEVDGVEWFQQIGDKTVTWTAARTGPVPGQTIYLDLTVPTQYEAQGAFLVDLAQPIKTALP